MPKVSNLKLFIKSQWGEYYEVHYNAKKAPLFSIKGLPEDFTDVTEVRTYGYATESELQRTIEKALIIYKKDKESSRKVIIYKSSATSELTHSKAELENCYYGIFPGVSKKLGSFGHGAEIASFGISYKIMMEVDKTNKKEYHTIKKDGLLGYGTELSTNEQVMEWTEEREVFFCNLYESMRKLVLQISVFIDKDAEEAAMLISNNNKLLG